MSHPVRARLGALAMLTIACSTPAGAQVRAVELRLDNDAYDFWVPQVRRPDHDYTNGIALALELDGAPLWGQALAPHAVPCGVPAGGCTRTELSFGQKIFTPLEHSDEPVPGQRPYAGWLYGEAAGALLTARGARELALQVGVTGPPSLAATVQTTWHRITGFYPPEGWDQQLAFEPGVLLRYRQRTLAAELRSGAGRVLTLVTSAGAEAGTVRAAGELGVDARAGLGVPHPWLPEATPSAFALYGIAALHGEAIAHDLFLDGSLWRRGVHAGHRPLVWQGELGAGAAWRSLTLEYRAVTRAREYAAQPAAHTWGSFTLRWQAR